MNVILNFEYFVNVNVILNFEYFVNVNVILNFEYFVNVNIILNFKKDIYIPLKPIPKTTLFVVDVSVTWATDRK